MQLSKFNFTGLLLGLLAISFWLALASSPNVAENIYAREIYPAIAGVLAFIGSIIPFALTDLVFAGCSFALIYFLVKPWFPLREIKLNWQAKVFRSVVDFVSLSGILFFLSCASFLYNHHRFSEEKLFDLAFELDKAQFELIYQQSSAEANVLSQEFERDKRGCSDIQFSLEEFDQLIEAQQSKFLTRHTLPAVQHAETKYFLFSWIWAGMGIAGQYQPLFGQPNITREMASYSKPLIIAHERAHLNGFASEAGANLVAFQTLFHSSDPRLLYLARLDLWRAQPPETINEQVTKDLQCWQQDWDKVERFSFDFLFKRVNDFYLKASGHKDGVNSYGRGRYLAYKYYYKQFVAKSS